MSIQRENVRFSHLIKDVYSFHGYFMPDSFIKVIKFNFSFNVTTKNTPQKIRRFGRYSFCEDKIKGEDSDELSP